MSIFILGSRRTTVAMVVATMALSFCIACHRAAPKVAKRYPLKGKIVAIDKPGSSLVVDHEAIPNFMGAMTMPYPVKDPAILDKIAIGDRIEAVVVVQERDENGGGYWLENVAVVGHSDEAPLKPADTFHVPEPGEAVPDFSLTNQSGRRISLSQYHGQVLLLTFIYTRCPFPEYCARVSGEFATLHHRLQEDATLQAKVHLLSISFDPAQDTPKVLREYGFSLAGKKDTALFGQWEFAAPKAADLPQIANYFGLTYAEDKGVITHSLSTAVIGPDGKIFKWYHGGEWTATDLMKDAAAALHASS